MATPKIKKAKDGFELKYTNNASIKWAERLFKERGVRTVVSGKILFVFSKIRTEKEFKTYYRNEIGWVAENNEENAVFTL